MKKLFAVAALVTLFPAAALAQRSYPPYGFRVFTDWQPASVRIDVRPDNADLFVDNRYLGVAGNFSGLRRLPLHSGPHLLEIRKPGYDSLAITLTAYAGQSITVSQTMRPTRGADDTPDVDTTARSFNDGAIHSGTDGPAGALRFDVTVKDAAIYADGFYVGIVDDFNGSQHMMLTQGTHHLVLKREGYQTIEANVTIGSERPLTYRTALTAATRTPVQLTASSATR